MKTFTRYDDTIPASIPVGAVAVTVYFNDRSYGGPEEGGWWYDDPTVTDVYLFRSLRKAKMHLRELRPLLARGYSARLEFQGANPIGRDSDGTLCSDRPWDLRPVYRGRELLCRPHYC
jgi:hypothetical protein